MRNMLEIFGEFCFTDEKLKSRIPDSYYKEFEKVQQGEKTLSIQLADSIANAVKNWASENGATHFTHWFQPLTELTAEKHDSFISLSSDGSCLSQFSGKELVKGEADTSSFPNGGVRSTFEARGYTVWDCKSPMFLRGEGLSKSLYIPTAFIGYNQMALDKKVPLLRSIDFITEQALRIKKIIDPQTQAKSINNTLGLEQEYFLIKKEYWEKRQDLMLGGRTIFGSLPPKGQEMNDHYFGSIKEKVEKVMNEIDTELWKIGIMAKTKHNEVAPNQFELALMFTTANVAVDQNQLTMDVIKKVADRHNLCALLHEKPFKGVNGSGKHCNWSLSTDTGENLLDPSSLSENNLQFLLFLTAILEGIDRYSNVLRASCATPGNDHRLGGHEAPPAIISVFIGEELEDILKNIENIVGIKEKPENMKFGVKNFTKIPKDMSDRNRTSPFAFTGNKFEFRMPGSSASASTPTFIINAIVGTVLKEYSDILEGLSQDQLIKGITELVKNRYEKHKRIIFNGNGYDASWKIEAEKRGLKNLKNTMEGIKEYKDQNIIDLFNNAGILNPDEVEARYLVYCERYIKQVNIEGSLMVRMARNEIYPAIMEYGAKISKSIKSISDVLGSDEYLEADKAHLIKLLAGKNRLKDNLSILESQLEVGTKINDLYEKVIFLNKEINPILEDMRKVIDSLEHQVEKKTWPVPTYEDMLFRL
ncbi:glutamine synthetase III [uncultured Cetobacterium sp.]|uniref:glutamine synthetase III family protein n=1 Tax=uncultured Cetobacterium sp. TaxID=527638 RepID=UPI002625FC5E|nr:glutamine synthetase III [uncultured Cetobacterium sp.]